MKKGILKKRTIVFLITAIICVMVPAAIFAASDTGTGEDPQEAEPFELAEPDDNSYYMQAGEVQTGFVTIDGNVYYFNEEGVMQTGFATIDGDTYYFGDDGIMRTGLQTIEGNVYYFAEGGQMQTGFQIIKNRTRYFNEEGIMQTGLATIDGSKYYFGPKGVMKTGVVKIKKKMFYFMEDGKGIGKKGWFKGLDGKKRYCYGKNSRIAWGEKKIKKIWYEFNTKNGRLIRRIGDGIDKKMQSYSSSTSYMVVCKVTEHRVRIYYGKKDNWKRIHKFKCTTGKPSTPTRKGIYSIRSKGTYFNTGTNMRCWYWCQYSGNYLFHSVLYDRSSEPVNVVDGRLGINASHGCIRLKLENAKYIYYNVPRGSKVVIY